MTGIRDLTAGKTRHLPVDPNDLFRMLQIAQSIAPDLGIDVLSGAQPVSGPGRTGSHRHDIDPATGMGHTADIVFTRGGRAILPNQDQGLYAKFFKAAAPYFPGMGHYNWGIHVGGGTPAFWGPDKTGATAAPAFARAYAEGRGTPLSAPPGSGVPMNLARMANTGAGAALGDVVAQGAMPMAPPVTLPNLAFNIVRQAEERREREEEAEDARRRALFTPTTLAGLYG